MKLEDWPPQDVSSRSYLPMCLLTMIELHEEYPKYVWYPEVLAKASHSGENLGYQLRKYLHEQDRSAGKLKSFVRDLVKNGLGISDASEQEVMYVVDNSHDLARVVYHFNDMVSRRSQTGWSTHGHSGTFDSHHSAPSYPY